MELRDMLPLAVVTQAMQIICPSQRKLPSGRLSSFNGAHKICQLPEDNKDYAFLCLLLCASRLEIVLRECNANVVAEKLKPY